MSFIAFVRYMVYYNRVPWHMVRSVAKKFPINLNKIPFSFPYLRRCLLFIYKTGELVYPLPHIASAKIHSNV